MSDPFGSPEKRNAALDEYERLLSQPDEEALAAIARGFLDYGAPRYVNRGDPGDPPPPPFDYSDQTVVSFAALAGPVMSRRAGLGIWNRLRGDVHNFLCSGNEPRDWVNEVVSGDARTVAVSIITAMVGDLGMPVTIAVPSLALVVKQGLFAFCASPLEHQPGLSPRESLPPPMAAKPATEPKAVARTATKTAPGAKKVPKKATRQAVKKAATKGKP